MNEKYKEGVHLPPPTPVRFGYFHTAVLDYMTTLLHATKSQVLRTALEVLLQHHPDADLETFKLWLEENVDPKLPNARVRRDIATQVARMEAADPDLTGVKPLGFDAPLLDGSDRPDFALELGTEPPETGKWPEVTHSGSHSAFFAGFEEVVGAGPPEPDATTEDHPEPQPAPNTKTREPK